MWFEGKWLQNWLRADKNESSSFLAVDIQGHQDGGLCIADLIASCDMFKDVPKIFLLNSTDPLELGAGAINFHVKTAFHTRFGVQ